MTVEVLQQEADHEAGADVDGERTDGKPLAKATGGEDTDEVAGHGAESSTQRNEQIASHAKTPFAAAQASAWDCRSGWVSFGRCGGCVGG